MEKENFIKLQKLISNSYDLKELAGHKKDSVLVNEVDTIRRAIELYLICLFFRELEDEEKYKELMLVCFNKHSTLNEADIQFFEKRLTHIQKTLRQ